ncbi:MAG: PAS domain S-box protein [Peptococcaceae bacterium]|nr:PAS domain S-box protein [Peptococcaceae bacterium]
MNEKTFTNTVIKRITILFTVIFVLCVTVLTRQVWHNMLNEKQKELLSIGTIVLNQVTSHGQELSAIKQEIGIPPDRKVLAINEILQQPLNDICNCYPNYSFGYYDLELKSIAALAPNNHLTLLTKIPDTHPWFSSYQSGKPEFIVHNTSLDQSKEALMGVFIPVYYQGEIIGHVWANMKKNDLMLLTANKVVIILGGGLICWGIIVLIARRIIRQYLNLWDEFSRQITEENPDLSVLNKVSDLAPSFKRIQKYIHSLKAAPNQTELFGTFSPTLTAAAEKDYRKKLYQLAAIVQSSIDGIMTVSHDGYIKLWNKASEKIYGYQATEILGKHLSILTPEELLLSDQDLFKAINQGKSTLEWKTIRLTKSGKTVNVSLFISPLYGEDNKVYGASIISRDNTNEVNTEKLLREEIKQRQQSEADFKTVFDKSKMGIVTRGKDGKVIRCNKAFENMIGYTLKELSNMDWVAINHPDDLEKENPLAEELLTGVRDYYEIEKRYLHKDGSVLWARSTIVLSKGYSEVTIAFIEDITEQKSYREQMLKLDRLNLIGEMAAGISHEVRNPMAAVRGFLQILQTKKELTPYEHYFSTMIEELDRANNIISEFLSIGRNTPTNMKEEDLNLIIESLKPLIEADGYATDHYLQVELAPVPKILLNNKEIRQMILNLVRNGFEAMPAGGTLTIKTYYQDQKVILAIIDQGQGIKPEVMEKLGTPFFTTKPNGTGLGLGICYGIAARHNADIKIETGPEGTTFYVEFNS